MEIVIFNFTFFFFFLCTCKYPLGYDENKLNVIDCPTPGVEGPRSGCARFSRAKPDKGENTGNGRAGEKWSTADERYATISSFSAFQIANRYFDIGARPNGNIQQAVGTPSRYRTEKPSPNDFQIIQHLYNSYLPVVFQ